MKIYSEPLDDFHEVQDKIKAIRTIQLKIDPDMEAPNQMMADMVLHYFKLSIERQQEIYRLNLRWDLRHLEGEINNEGGNFLIEKNGDLSMKGFSSELCDKIRATLKK